MPMSHDQAIRAGKKAAATRRKNEHESGLRKFFIHYYGASGKHRVGSVKAKNKTDALKKGRRKWKNVIAKWSG